MASKYNVDKNDNEENMSGAAFSRFNDEHTPLSVYCKSNLQSKLTLSGMVFCLPGKSEESEEMDMDKENTNNLDLEMKVLEEVIEEEGLAFFGGFVVHKFPQYNLGSKASTTEDSWISTLDRGNLMKPSFEFLEQLKSMEKMFKCYHGLKTLKPGKTCVQKASSLIAELVSLPKEVITYFVRCRMFFRMRVLNKKLISSKKTVNKLKKMIE